MAPRKEKAEKVSADESADLILAYLRKQNRPYSATDISANLHNRVTRTAAAKTLREMHERKEIEGRAAGKQVVYHVIQNPAEAATPEELQAMDDSIQRLRDETAQAKTTEKTLKSALTSTNSTLSTVDLRASLAALEAERAEVLARLGPLRAGSVRPMPAEEKAGVEAELKKWERTERARAKIAREMWAFVRENLPEGTEAGELRERLGLDE